MIDFTVIKLYFYFVTFTFFES